MQYVRFLKTLSVLGALVLVGCKTTKSKESKPFAPYYSAPPKGGEWQEVDPNAVEIDSTSRPLPKCERNEGFNQDGYLPRVKCQIPQITAH